MWAPDKPWLVAPNITPDRETGAGTWTDDMLARAIREGIGHDGRVLDPQMWSYSFRQLCEEDVASVVAYLRSVPAVRNPLPRTRRPKDRPAPTPAEPLTAPVPGPRSNDPVERGRYLAKVVDCGGCHTSWYGTANPGFFGGANLIERAGLSAFSTNITPDPSGIPYYDAALFREVMRTGRVGGRHLSPVMPWIAYRNLSDADLDALFAFLRTRPAVRHNVSNHEPPTQCAACGQKHGWGDRNPKKDAAAQSVPPADLDGLPGVYRFADGFTIEVRRERDRLLVHADDRGTPLYRVGDGLYTSDGLADVLRFERDPSGRAVAAFSVSLDERAPRVP